MDRAIAMRAELKEVQDDEVVPSLNDFVVKACAMALRRHPRVNASYADGHFKLHGRVNIGVAVASEDALVVPVVRDADARSLGAIARETRRLAARVRAGEITPPELVRRDVHGLEPGHVRDDRDHARDQPPAGGDPRRRGHP